MYLRMSRARQSYTCAGCGGPILRGALYFRDEPHPMARRHRAAVVRLLCGRCVPTGGLHESPTPPDSEQLGLLFDSTVISLPPILLQAAVIELGTRVDEGQIVVGVTIPWFEIIREVARDPDFLFKVPWRKLEELVAGAYEREGWKRVTLTPRTGDRGRDIIVEKPGVCAIRVIDQVKAYSPGHRVCADDIRALLGVLTADANVSKGIVTTTTEFAPGIRTDQVLNRFMPYRLELKEGPELRAWLVSIWQKAKRAR